MAGGYRRTAGPRLQVPGYPGGVGGDAELIQIVDAALAEAARKAGSWLACRPGCFECCIGPFAINQLDAARLRRGLVELAASDPRRAGRVRRRARKAAGRMTRDYPGNTPARVLAEDGAAENVPCPALDPETGTCDLYAARPLTCRTFGPPVRCASGALAICELCFQGASEEEIERCVVELDAEVLAEVEGADAELTVASALA